MLHHFSSRLNHIRERVASMLGSSHPPNLVDGHIPAVKGLYRVSVGLDSGCWKQGELRVRTKGTSWGWSGRNCGAPEQGAQPFRPCNHAAPSSTSIPSTDVWCMRPPNLAYWLDANYTLALNQCIFGAVRSAMDEHQDNNDKKDDIFPESSISYVV
eukprot:4107794-Amphidinium_carterae.1